MADGNNFQGSTQGNGDNTNQANGGFATYGGFTSAGFTAPTPPPSNPTSQNPPTTSPVDPTPPPTQNPPASPANAQPSPFGLAPSQASPVPGAGYQPAAGGGQADPFGGDGSLPTPPPTEEDTTPANFQLGSMLPKIIDIKIPAHTLQFDEQYFLHMLGGSISLTKEEKKRIIDSIPRLRQSQVDELIRIFEEERKKFAELSAKHVEQLKKLEKQHHLEWEGIELDQKAEEKKNADQAKAEAIRKSLGI